MTTLEHGAIVLRGMYGPMNVIEIDERKTNHCFVTGV